MKLQNIFQKKKKDTRRAMMKEIEEGLEQLPHPIQYMRGVSAGSGADSMDYVILSPGGIFIVNQQTETGHIQADMEEKTWYLNDTVEIANPFSRLDEKREAVQAGIPSQYHDYFVSIASFLSPSTFDIAPIWRKSSSSRILIHHQELSEYIQRNIFISRFQQKTPLLNKETITMLYDTLSSSLTGHR
ncbi:Nuclease-related domain-containing protein [Salibacterium qingdaonense]|uniref:Nuclease-related domain-containing protein n=2 Tax=Salibacterium qingdaonense TaxID=266892 RepID=A0A1I4MFM3_9BACI|nr:Nuclease-related domain-containing protein [Salibacterium qingdaonense]